MGVKLRERPDKGWYVFISWQGKRKAKAFGSNEKSAQLFAQKMAYRLKEAEQEGTSVMFADSQKTMSTVKDYDSLKKAFLNSYPLFIYKYFSLDKRFCSIFASACHMR